MNGDSEHKTPAVGDANMRTIKQGEVIQLERKVGVAALSSSNALSQFLSTGSELFVAMSALLSTHHGPMSTAGVLHLRQGVRRS